MSFSSSSSTGATTKDELVVTEQLVKVASGQFDVSIVQQLSLAHLTLCKIHNGLQNCSFLTDLNLSDNHLVSLDGLQHVAATLVYLDVSANFLDALDPLASCKLLQVVKLQQNRISAVERLSCLANGNHTQLRAIHLQDRDRTRPNPCCSDREAYLAALNKMFPNVRSIDGHFFCKEDASHRYIDAGDDREIVLPPSQPWVAQDYFKSMLFDASKASAPTEKAFYALAADCKKSAASAVK